MKLQTEIPKTSTIKVVYTHQGTTYGAIIANPRTYVGILTALNTSPTRQVGIGQIVRIESLSPQVSSFQRRF
jgi:hypothetical protein